MKILAISVAAIVFGAGICHAQKLPAWERGPSDDAGASAMVELVKLSGNAAGAFFGLRCYNDPDKFFLGNSAYFLKIDNTEFACLKDPVTNVSLTIDGKTYPYTFRCDDKIMAGGGSLYFEWGEESRADLNNMYDLGRVMDKARSKEMIVSVTDKNHYLFRGSLQNASIRNKLKCPMKR